MLAKMERYLPANILRIYVEGFACVLYQMGWEHAAVGASDFIALLVTPNVPIVHPVHSIDHAEIFYALRSRVHRDAIRIDTLFL